MKICIDPGHSGPCEPGACAGGVTEANINLQVAKIAARILASRGHEVKLTREKDIDNDDLLWRAETCSWPSGQRNCNLVTVTVKTLRMARTPKRNSSPCNSSD